MENFIFITSLSILGIFSFLAWFFPRTFVNVLRESQKSKRKFFPNLPKPISNYMFCYGESSAYIWLMRIVLLIAIAGVIIWFSL